MTITVFVQVWSSIDKTCAYSGAFEFKNKFETSKMCCTGGKVKWPDLYLPTESTSVSGDTSQSKHFLVNVRDYNLCLRTTLFGASNTVHENYTLIIFNVREQSNLSTSHTDSCVCSPLTRWKTFGFIRVRARWKNKKNYRGSESTSSINTIQTPNAFFI